MRATLSELLGSSMTLGLIDKSMDRRTASAQDLEAFVSKKCAVYSTESRIWIEQCIISLKEELLQSSHMQSRTGGLIALASIALGIPESLRDVLQSDILEICLKMVDDEEPRVRYFACESVFNIVKASGARCVPLFAAVFDFLCKVSADTEVDIRQTGPILDRTLREMIADHFSKSTTDPNIVSIVETHLVYPSPIVKQLSISWVEFLITIRNSGILERLASVLPPLLAYLSSGSAPSAGRKDLSVQAGHILDELLRESKKVSQPVIERTLSVLVKYGTFQDTLSIRARVVVFRWLTVFAPRSIDSREVVSVVKVLITSLGSCSDGTVLEAIEASNTSLLASTDFARNLRSCDSRSLTEVFGTHLDPTRPSVTSAVVDWINILGDKMKITDIEPLLGLRVDERVMRICTAHLGLEHTSRALLVKMHNTAQEETSRDLFRLLFGVIDSADSLRVITGAAVKERDRGSIFALIRVILGDAKLRDGPLQNCKNLIERWATFSPMGAIIAWIYCGDYALARTQADRLGNGDVSAAEFDVFAQLHESEIFTSHRLALVSESSAELVKCLVRLCMLMDQDSKAFKTFFNRLQLVKVFKLL